MAATAVAGHYEAMSRPQIGIDRLPVRRASMNEPKEAMNCKSCRKRKVGCPTTRAVDTAKLIPPRSSATG